MSTGRLDRLASSTESAKSTVAPVDTGLNPAFERQPGANRAMSACFLRSPFESVWIVDYDLPQSDGQPRNALHFRALRRRRHDAVPRARQQVERALRGSRSSTSFYHTGHCACRFCNTPTMKGETIPEAELSVTVVVTSSFAKAIHPSATLLAEGLLRLRFLNLPRGTPVLIAHDSPRSVDGEWFPSDYLEYLGRVHHMLPRLRTCTGLAVVSMLRVGRSGLASNLAAAVRSVRTPFLLKVEHDHFYEERAVARHPRRHAQRPKITVCSIQPSPQCRHPL